MKQYALYYSIGDSVVLNCLHDKFDSFEQAHSALYTHVHYIRLKTYTEYRIIERDLTTGKRHQVLKRVFSTDDIETYNKLSISQLSKWIYSEKMFNQKKITKELKL